MILRPNDLKSRLRWYSRMQVVLAGALLVLGGLTYLLVIRPAQADLEQAHAQYASARTELEQDQERAKNLPRVEMEIDRLRQRVARFEKKLPRDQDLAAFIDDITRISQQASLRKLSWHLDAKSRRQDQLTELPIQFTFEGDFQSGVVEFLRGAEDLQRLTRIRKLDITSGDSRDGQVKAALTMNIYFGDEK